MVVGLPMVLRCFVSEKEREKGLTKPGNESILTDNNRIWCHSQVVRQRSATPLSPVQIRVAPFFENAFRRSFFVSKKVWGCSGNI